MSEVRKPGSKQQKKTPPKDDEAKAQAVRSRRKAGGDGEEQDGEDWESRPRTASQVRCGDQPLGDGPAASSTAGVTGGRAGRSAR